MKLPDGVSQLLAPNPSPMTLTGTNSYLVRGENGAAVIDPGPEIETHLGAIASEAARQGGLLAIIVTHGHPDHAAGAARLREMTGAPIVAWSREGVPTADQTLADGDVYLLGGRGLRAIFTPGHRYDHLCLALENGGVDTGVVFAGDLVAGAGTVVIAPSEGDLGQYLDSLNRLLAREPTLLLPGHGPERADSRALLEGYIAHREDRERQLLVALGGEPEQVMALVARIYTDTEPALHPIAAYSTLAGLLKLEREGRVVRTAGQAGDGEPSAEAGAALALEGVVGRPDGLSARWRLA